MGKIHKERDRRKFEQQSIRKKHIKTIAGKR